MAEATGNPEFITAAEAVKGLSYKPNNEELLTLYGLFKQSIVGDNDTPRPGMFDLQGRAKHDAWTKNKVSVPTVPACPGMSKEDAQAKYIAYVKELQAKP
ncbi:acyl-CoA-binding protein [Zopfochytrium polystomum]|nr:acyl-CoA-binding protein [Zopfochytrium polystomum]